MVKGEIKEKLIKTNNRTDEAEEGIVEAEEKIHGMKGANQIIKPHGIQDDRAGGQIL